MAILISVVHGWYMPNQSELNLLYSNKTAFAIAPSSAPLCLLVLCGWSLVLSHGDSISAAAYRLITAKPKPCGFGASGRQIRDNRAYVARVLEAVKENHPDIDRGIGSWVIWANLNKQTRIDTGSARLRFLLC